MVSSIDANLIDSIGNYKMNISELVNNENYLFEFNGEVKRVQFVGPWRGGQALFIELNSSGKHINSRYVLQNEVVEPCIYKDQCPEYTFKTTSIYDLQTFNLSISGVNKNDWLEIIRKHIVNEYHCSADELMQENTRAISIDTIVMVYSFGLCLESHIDHEIDFNASLEVKYV